MNNQFKVWNTDSPQQQYVPSANLSAAEYYAGGKIYADMLNGILQDVSLVTVQLLEALAESTSADTSSMVFNNAQSSGDIKTNIKTMIQGVKAPALKNPITVKIENNSHTALATATTDASTNDPIVLTLPATVAIDISGNAATANYAKHLDHTAKVLVSNSVASVYTMNLDMSASNIGITLPDVSPDTLRMVDANWSPLNVGGNKSAVIFENGVPTTNTSWNAGLFDNIMSAFNLNNFLVKSDGTNNVPFSEYDPSKNYIFIVTGNHSNNRFSMVFFKQATAVYSSTYRTYNRTYKIRIQNSNTIQLMVDAGSGFTVDDTMDTVVILSFSKVTPYSS